MAQRPLLAAVSPGGDVAGAVVVVAVPVARSPRRHQTNKSPSLAMPATPSATPCGGSVESGCNTW